MRSTKAFVLGAISGALAYAVASWLIADKQDQRMPLPLVVEPERHTPPTSRHSIAELESEADSENGPEPDLAPTSQTDLRPNEPDQSRDDADPAFQWLAREYERLMAEAKDESWAHYAEQAILQFLAHHPSMNEFEIAYIECRTTLCQIRVNGYAERSGPTWHRIMYDMSEQSWDEFGQRGTASSMIDGRLVIIQHLHRR